MKRGTTRKTNLSGRGESTNLIQSGNDNQATINNYHSTPMPDQNKATELELLREVNAAQQRLIYFYQQQR